MSPSLSHLLAPKVGAGPITKDLTIVRAGGTKTTFLSSGIITTIGIMMNHAVTRKKILACFHVVTSIQQMAVPDSVYFAGGTELSGIEVFFLGLEKNKLEILLDFAKGGKSVINIQ